MSGWPLRSRGSERRTLLSAERDLDLGTEIRRLRGDPARDPDGSVVVPVNAQGDVDSLFVLLGDLARYRGTYAIEVVPVLNNYPPDDVPSAIGELRRLGVAVVALPDARRPGEKVGFSARMPGVSAARSAVTIHLDADCRVPDPTALIDHYVTCLRSGASLAYTPVGYYDTPGGLAVRVRIAIHHFTRWIKRNVLRMPTPRGSNYALDRSLMLSLYGTGQLIEDFNIGPNIKAMAASHRYSGHRNLVVLTSGRKLGATWKRLYTYVRWRLRFNADRLRDRGAASSLRRT